MATRSTIAIETTAGQVQQIYCHWDGYLSHNGAILNEHYSDPAKLQQLIDIGDVSSLGNVIGEKHPFSKFDVRADDPDRESKLLLVTQAEVESWTTFYGRDRGESGIKARVFDNFEMYRISGDSQEYNYILRNDGKWYVRSGRGFVELAELLESSVDTTV